MIQPLLLRLLIVFCVALSPTVVMALDAGVSFAVYRTQDGKPYVEVNHEIAAGSVMYRHIDSVLMQASVDVLILVKDGEKVVNFEKYTLQSPLVPVPEALLDVKRMAIPPGNYTLEVSVQDVQDATNTDQFSSPLSAVLDGKIALSEVQLLRGFKPDNSDSPFSKNGFYL